jgi:hypothetical protein
MDTLITLQNQLQAVAREVYLHDPYFEPISSIRTNKHARIFLRHIIRRAKNPPFDLSFTPRQLARLIGSSRTNIFMQWFRYNNRLTAEFRRARWFLNQMILLNAEADLETRYISSNVQQIEENPIEWPSDESIGVGEVVDDENTGFGEVTRDESIGFGEVVDDESIDFGEVVDDEDTGFGEVVDDESIDFGEVVDDEDTGSGEVIHDESIDFGEVVDDEDTGFGEVIHDESIGSGEITCDESIGFGEVVDDENTGSGEVIHDESIGSGEVTRDESIGFGEVTHAESIGVGEVVDGTHVSQERMPQDLESAARIGKSAEHFFHIYIRSFRKF